MKPMKLWILKPSEKGKRLISWDCCDGMVVASSTAYGARKAAAANAGKEGATFWTDSRWSTCKALDASLLNDGAVVLCTSSS
jgi:hypothetical protein